MNNDDILFGTDFFDLELDNKTQKEKLMLREGELREVTILFADIKGFTDLSTHYDPEIIHLKMDEIMKIFSKCITFYGGFVDKYMGDGIMALFGAKKATEQDPQRAILAALKMQQQLRLYNSLLNEQESFREVTLGLRIGINSGLVSVGKVGESREGDFTVYGPEVNLASRMESNAPVNRIMLPDHTKKIIEHIFEFEHRGEIQVKGIEEAINCWTVIGLKTEKAPRWQSSSHKFIGREIELKTLFDAYTQIQSAAAISTEIAVQIIGIQGEPGLGKTRLIYEFEKQIQTINPKPKILHAACNGICPTPLNLFANLFEAVFGLRISEALDTKKQKLTQGFKALETDNTKQQEALNDALNMIAFLLEIRGNDPRLKQSGKDLLQHLLEATETVIKRFLEIQAGQNRPLILILDDLHWIDESSELVLNHIIRILNTEDFSFPCLILLIYRPEYDQQFMEIENFKSLSLNPFSEEEIRSLIKDYTSEIQLSDETREKVISLSNGNPFYLEEWCNYIKDLPLDDMHGFPVPVNLHALILSRLDKLPDSLRLLLQKASVIGQEFFLEILRAVEDRLRGSSEIEPTLKALEDEALILKALGFDFSSYFFRHITTREVAYQTLLMANRKMLHQLTGEAIETLFRDRLEQFHYALAIHFLMAEINHKARFYLDKAALAAAQIFNNTQALNLYGKLLDLVPENEMNYRAQIMIRMADIRWLIGEWEQADNDAEQAGLIAKQLGDKKIEAEALRFQGTSAFYRGNLEVAKQCFDKMHIIATETKDKLLICVASSMLGIWNQHHGDFESALKYHNTSLELAEELGEKQRSAKTLSNIGLIHLEKENYPEAARLFEKCLDISSEYRFQKEESIALGNLGVLKICTEEYDDARILLDKKLLLARKMNDIYEQIKALGNLGNIQSAQKDHTRAIEYYSQVYSLREQIGDQAGMESTKKVISMEKKKLGKSK